LAVRVQDWRFCARRKSSRISVKGYSPAVVAVPVFAERDAVREAAFGAPFVRRDAAFGQRIFAVEAADLSVGNRARPLNLKEFRANEEPAILDGCVTYGVREAEAEGGVAGNGRGAGEATVGIEAKSFGESGFGGPAEGILSAYGGERLGVRLAQFGLRKGAGADGKSGASDAKRAVFCTRKAVFIAHNEQKTCCSSVIWSAREASVGL